MRTHKVEVSEEQEDEKDIADITRVHAVSPSIPRSYKVSLKIPITMKLDTGASVALVSEATWSDKLNKPPVQPCTLSLQSYPKSWGSVRCMLVFMEKEAYLPLVVVEGSGPPTIWEELVGVRPA